MATQAEEPSIPWVTSVDDAIAQAKTTGKLVLLDFFSPT
jgi:hypothetical protein